jgi:hypothetical protein
VRKKGLRQQQVVAQKISSTEGFPPKEAWDNKLWPRKSHPLRDSHPKRPEKMTSCGLENPIHWGVPIQRGPEQQWAVA